MDELSIRLKIKEALTLQPKRHINKILSKEETVFFENLLKEKGDFTLEEGIRYFVMRDLPIEPKFCKICGKPIYSIRRQGREWKTYCSNYCMQHDPDLQKKIQETNLKKYGYRHSSQNPEYKKRVSDKIKQTNLERYGVTSTAKLSSVIEKRNKTNLEKYGSICSLNNDVVKQKAQKTLLEKYGTLNVMQDESVKQKAKQTMDERYGGYTLSSNLLKQKVDSTMLEKYGTTTPIKNDEIKAKTENTCLERYGVKAFAGSKINKERALSAGYDLLLDKTINNPNSKVIPLFNREEYKGSSYTTIYKWLCKECGNSFEASYGNTIVPTCRKCHPITISSGQQEVIDSIKSIYDGPIEVNTRKVIAPLELDIYLPELKLAIEYNGTYWHSTKINKNPSYHSNKSDYCEQQDIHLIHIFEYQWTNNRRQVKQRLANILGSYTNKVFARKCIVREIDFNITSDFLNNYHLQGSCTSKVNLGLFYNDELVSVMTFGKPRFNKDYQWELIRFCNKEGCHVIGAASKLMKYFERNYKPESIISYANRCWSWSKHNVYKDILGMEYIGKSDANYVYVNEAGDILPRYKAQKHKLKKLLGEDKFFEELTETENMELNGWIKLYDCGNFVFGKKTLTV